MGHVSLGALGVLPTWCTAGKFNPCGALLLLAIAEEQAMPVRIITLADAHTAVSADGTAPVTVATSPLGKSRPNTGGHNRAYRGHSKPLPVHFNIRDPGRCRIGHLLTLLQISHSKYYAELKAGKIPPPDGNDGRPWWRNETISQIVEA